MFTNFRESIRDKELNSFRLLNVIAGIVVAVLGFIFEFVYHDAYILKAGLFISFAFLSNYLLSFRSNFYRIHFLNMSYAAIFLLHCWAVYLVYLRGFDIAFLLPVSLSIFIFSLIFNRSYKSVLFIAATTSFLMALMWSSGHWQADYSIGIIAFYSGAIMVNVIVNRKNRYHLEIETREKQHLTLVESMNDGLIYINNINELTFANDRFWQITGYSKKEFTGKNTFSLNRITTNEASFETFLVNLNKGLNAGCETMIEKHDGETAWVMLSGTPVFDDNKIKTGSMIVFNDITSLKATEERLRKREKGFRTFIDQIGVGIWRAEFKEKISVDLPVEKQIDLMLNTGHITECNDFMAKMYGYKDAKEFLGLSVRDFYCNENKMPEHKVRELMATYIRNNYRATNTEAKEINYRGNIRYTLNNNIGIIENGLLISTCGVQTDITDRKNAENELLETNQELDTFFYKSSHDLKGPLASILGIVNLARMENVTPHSEKYFDMIETSVKRLDLILLDLMELARTRRAGSRLSVINLKGLVDETLQSLVHLEGIDKIYFEKHVDSSIEITADKVLMFSIFQNLIHNAINYCNGQNPRVRIHVKETEYGVELEVSDNGKGIPAHIKNKVFEMFYRGQPEYTGSGLGLFIVKNAIDKMKGKIRFESNGDNGTSFFVDIPNALIEA